MLFKQNHVSIKVLLKIWNATLNFWDKSPKYLKIPAILTFLLHVSRKFSQVSRFLAKSSDSRKNFVFLPKQTFLEFTPPVVN